MDTHRRQSTTESPKRVVKTGPRKRDTTSSEAADAQQSSKDEVLDQVVTSLSVIASSEDEHVKSSADPVVGEEISMSEVKSSRGRPEGDGYFHNAQWKRRTADRTARSSQVGEAIQNISGSNVDTSEVGGTNSNQVEASSDVPRSKSGRNESYDTVTNESRKSYSSRNTASNRSIHDRYYDLLKHEWSDSRDTSTSLRRWGSREMGISYQGRWRRRNVSGSSVVWAESNARWCFWESSKLEIHATVKWRKRDVIRNRFVLRQFRNTVNSNIHTEVSRSAVVRRLLTLSIIHSLFVATIDFSLKFIQTPTTEEVYQSLQWK